MHACLFLCVEMELRRCTGGDCYSKREGGSSACDDRPADDPSLSGRKPGFVWGVGWGSAEVFSAWTERCEDKWWQTDECVSNVSEEREEDTVGSSVGNSKSGGEGGEDEEEDDSAAVLTCCWVALVTLQEGEEEEVSPSNIAGSASPFFSPVPSSFPSFEQVPSSCLLLGSSCPAGFWLAAGVSWLETVVVGDWLLSWEWQRGQVSWT